MEPPLRIIETESTARERAQLPLGSIDRIGRMCTLVEPTLTGLGMVRTLG
jgi:hypothetical protein